MNVDVFYPGAVFSSREAFKEAVAEELAETRRRCNFPENNRVRIAAKCKNSECDYVVHGRLRPNGSVAVSSCHVMHSCRPGSSPATPMNLVMRVARAVVRYDGDAKPGAVISRAQVDHGYVVTYNQAYRALETLRKSYKTTSELSYGLILPWLQGLQDTNPGSITHFERAESGNITKAFVLLNSWAKSLLFCLPVVSLGACHLRCKEGGTLFLASALSPNRDIVIIAAGIGVMEDADHWAWFTRLLREGAGIQEFEDTVVMSDRKKGLDSAICDVLSTVPHSYCSFHLKKNVVNGFKIDLKGKIHTLAKALTPHELNAIMEECEELSADAAQYLKDIGNHKWTAAHFPRPRFGMVTTNISESSNSWLLNEREYSWFSCLSSIVRKTQQRMFDLRAEYSGLTSRFAPWVEAKVMKFYSIAESDLSPVYLTTCTK